MKRKTETGGGRSWRTAGRMNKTEVNGSKHEYEGKEKHLLRSNRSKEKHLLQLI